MIETIVHVADLHVRNFQRLDESKASMERFLYDMKETVHPDRIVIAGDLVHSKNLTSPEASDMAGWFLGECSDICPVILTLGNHDLLVENKDRMDALTPIVNRLNSPQIQFLKHSGVYPDDNINWVVFSVLDETLPVISYRVADKKYYGIYHGAIQGVQTDTGYRFGDNGANTRIFDDLDAVFCGDIHNRFVLKNNIDKPVIMVGSFTQQTYREKLNEHGYCIFKVSDGSYSFVDIPSNVQYMTFQITDFDDIKTESEKLLNK